MPEEHLFEIRADRTAALANEIGARLHAGVIRRGSASLVLAGGSTPAPLFDLLSATPAPWDKTSITLTDERWVDPADPASNEHMARAHLLTNLAAAAWFLGLKTPAATPQAAAGTVQQALEALPRPFDAVILGMGADGHIASLFPHAPELPAALDLTAPNLVIPIRREAAAGADERLSMTLRALLGAESICILIDGEEKLDVYRRAVAGDDAAELPVRAILNQTTTPVELWWAP